MIKLDYKFEIHCRNCGKLIRITTDINDFVVTHVAERSLGIETEYEYRNNFICTDCDDEIVVGIDVYEYPKDWLMDADVFGFGYYKEYLKEHLDKEVKNFQENYKPNKIENYENNEGK